MRPHRSCVPGLERRRSPMSLSPALRRAAVLISALDTEASEALFGQMSAEEAAKLRSALVELDEIPVDEQQQVLADFLRQQDASAQSASRADQSVTLDLNPALEAAIASARAAGSAAPPSPVGSEPQSF